MDQLQPILNDIDHERGATHQRARRMLRTLVAITVVVVLVAGTLVFQRFLADQFNFRSQVTKEIEKQESAARQEIDKRRNEYTAALEKQRGLRAASATFAAITSIGSKGMTEQVALGYYLRNWQSILATEKLADLAKTIDFNHLAYDTASSVMTRALVGQLEAVTPTIAELKARLEGDQQTLSRLETRLSDARRDDKESLFIDTNSRFQMILLGAIGLLVIAVLIPLHNAWRFLLNKEQALYAMRLATLLSPADPDARKKMAEIMLDIQKIPGGIPADIREILDRYVPKVTQPG